MSIANTEAVRRYRDLHRDEINAKARDRWAELRALRGDPCIGHACDNCRACAVLAKCCRGDNPQYKLPEIGSVFPFFGQLGVVEEDDDTVRCHVCGDWFKRLTQHIWHNHDLNSAEYRSAFGLAWRQPLVSRHERKSMTVGLEPYQSQDGEWLALIRPTRERTAMLSSRPERLQVRRIKDVSRRARMRELNEHIKGRPRDHNEAICGVCGAMFAVPPSVVWRGRRTCGQESCRATWRDRYRGRIPTNAKLRAEDVAGIKMRLARGESYSAIAALYGVSSSNVGMIARGDIWQKVLPSAVGSAVGEPANLPE